MYLKIFKRIIDFLVSLLAIIVISPVLVGLILALAFFHRGKVFFIQARPGKNEKIFKLIKFKTMNDKKDAGGNLLADKERITKLGHFIRSTSLDELPQLINVLKGDMSLIGPRPLLVSYLTYYNAFQKRRHEVKPGITGWAQVNGRNAISWEERFKLDVWYVEHVSLPLDVRIISKTIVKVFKREGVNANRSTTMPRFTGTQIHNTN